ncbi:Carnitinyl-CoA dehydratase [Nocardioides sp. AX2bis]|nr:Carnitinyl-CoA dehydratase [Nocardioides sp. AX2bis]
MVGAQSSEGDEMVDDVADDVAEGPVLVEEREGGVLVVTLNRPQARNAVDAATAQALAAAVDRLEAGDHLRAGVLTGAGGTFCAGMDLKAFLRGETPMLPGRGFGGLTARPARKPMIAAVEGWAVAGGFELVLACDLVVAARTARFGVPEVKRGLVAAAGAAVLLPQRIPRAVALEMLFTGDPIDAERAEALGLVNRVTEEGGALLGALELAGRIAVNGPLAVRVTQQVAREAADWTFDEAWERQDELTRPVFLSDDAQEGSAAFAEKRAPRWTGR